MADTNETTTDIIAEMRRIRVREFQDYANRLEAAHRRERGDCAKLREALEELMKFTCNSCQERYCEEDVEEEDGQSIPSPCSVIIKARAALAEPVKNCEVGTAKKQAERFAEYCDSEVCKRNRCKSQAKALCIERCALAWAQMPYKEGGAK